MKKIILGAFTFLTGFNSILFGQITGITGDAGSTATNIIISTIKTISSPTTITGIGNITIKNGGKIITAQKEEMLTISIQGNINIETGGVIRGSVFIQATNLTVNGDIDAAALSDTLGYAYNFAYTNYILGPNHTVTFPPDPTLDNIPFTGSHGGLSADGKKTYGSITRPFQKGAKGHNGPIIFGEIVILGGQGGGVIRLSISRQLIVNGTITSNGGKGKKSSTLTGQSEAGLDQDGVETPIYGSGGAGGSVWIETDVFSGTGSIKANGGTAFSGGGNGGAGGRIALYYGSNSFSGTVLARGSQAGSDGGTGTIYKKNRAQPYGDIIIDNKNTNVENPKPTPIDLSENITIGNIILQNEATANFIGSQRMVINEMNISSNSAVSVDGMGYKSGGPGEGEVGANPRAGGGAGYGGVGGLGEKTTGGGPTYGSLTQPTDLGSAGGPNAQDGSGNGGGIIKVNIIGVLNNNGKISANGGNGGKGDGGGSGGSILLSVGELKGSGIISANGGKGGTKDGYEGGGGGGGRIAIYYGSKTYSGVITVKGGTGYKSGSVGTIYLKSGLLVLTSASSSVCLGSSVTIGGFPTAGGGMPPYTYTWIPSVGLSNPNVANPIASPSVTTVYTVTVMDASGSISSSSSTQTVIVRRVTLSDLTTNATPTGVCLGDRVTLIGGGVDTYTWSDGIRNLPNEAVIAPYETKTYTVTAIQTCGKVYTETKTIVVHPLPKITITPPYPALFPGTPFIRLTASGAHTYTWHTTSTNVTPVDLNRFIGPNVICTPTANVGYAVRGTSIFGCKSGERIDEVAVVDIDINTKYCGAPNFYSDEAYIKTVKLPGGITNTSGDNNGYKNFTSISCNMSVGGQNTISITAGKVTNPSKANYKIWIDWNKNGSFDDDEGTAILNGITTSTNIIIPSSALSGPTRMRISLSTTPRFLTPCLFYISEYGEAEDYTVNIINPLHPFLPEASFVINSDPPFCLEVGKSIFFTNTSINAKTFKWEINGVLFSTIRNPSIRPISSGAVQIKLTAYDQAGISSVYTDSFVIADCNKGRMKEENADSTEVMKKQKWTQKIAITDEIKVYPNPNNGNFTVDVSDNTRIIIFDAIGKVLRDEQLTSGSTQFYFENYLPGFYFIKAIQNNKTNLIKLIKE